MRTIKFRGKRIDNSEWVYGYLYELPLPSGEACMILTQDNNHLDNSLEPKYHLAFTLWVDLFVVDPATVGQFTGLQDANGTDVYEGDILHYPRNNKTYQVVFKDGIFWGEGENGCGCAAHFFPSCEVVGNVFDNLDLLK